MLNKIFVAGHLGMVGSAILRKLKTSGSKVITANRVELDLTNQCQVENFFKKNKVNQVYLAAAKVGGIQANNIYPAEFIYYNLMIQNNIIHSAFKNGVEKLLFLGSSCIYPKMASQPIMEEELLSGKLEPTNEPYAVAKIAGIKMCESYNRQYGTDFRTIMPTNLYGPGDNYNLENSHVLPALLAKFHYAKETKASEVIAWGSGLPRREFLHVDDMASASICVMDAPYQKYKEIIDPMNSHLNVGSGKDCSIKELAEMISKTVGFKGEVVWDTSKPDGVPRKLMDSSKLRRLGWAPSISLETGLKKTYKNFLGMQE